MTNLSNLPWGLIVFLLSQTIAAVGILVKMYFSIQGLQAKVGALDTENKELRGQLKELSDTLLLVKNNTDLLLLGRIKTGNIKQ